MLLGQLAGRSGWSAEDNRTFEFTGTLRKRLRGIIHNLIKCKHGKIPGHHLHNGTPSVHCRTDTNPRKSQLRDRSIHYTPGTEFIQHSLADFICSIVFSYLFTHQKNRFIPAHLFDRRLPQGIAKRDNSAHDSTSNLEGRRYVKRMKGTDPSSALP